MGGNGTLPQVKGLQRHKYYNRHNNNLLSSEQATLKKISVKNREREDSLAAKSFTLLKKSTFNIGNSF